MLVHLAESDEQVFIDYREMAPSRASRNMFLNEDGSVNRGMAYNSTSAAGVPGTVAGMIHALERYGTMDLATVIQPAIDLAEKGFEVPAALHLNLRAGSERLSRNEEAKRVHLRAQVKHPRWAPCSNNPTLPPPLSASAEGRDGFYKGKTAELVVAEMNRTGGIMSLDDMAGYQAIERTPVRGTFRGYDVVSAPPPSSGGVHVMQILKLLEPFPIEEMGHNSANYLHHLIEAMKLAYADQQILGRPGSHGNPHRR